MSSRQNLTLNCACFLALVCLLPCCGSDVSAADETQNSAAADGYKLGIVGFKFVMRSRRVPMISIVYPDTPAEGAGLKRGDQIASIDGLSTENLTKREIFDRFTGKPGTSVDVSILRGGDNFAVSLKRIKLNTLNGQHPNTVKEYLSSPTQ